MTSSLFGKPTSLVENQGVWWEKINKINQSYVHLSDDAFIGLESEKKSPLWLKEFGKL